MRIAASRLSAGGGEVFFRLAEYVFTVPSTMKSRMAAKSLVPAACAACRSFARYQGRFFQFVRRPGWRGWEDWLTVEIGRRMDSREVIPFSSYPGAPRKHADLIIDGGGAAPAAIVEIKVNFIDRDEVESKEHLPDRVLDDLEKLRQAGSGARLLMLVATCFPDTRTKSDYRKRMNGRRLPRGWRPRWHDCSAGGSGLLLLELERRPV